MQIALDLFNCGSCGELLRSRQVHRGTDCQCPFCGTVQRIPGKRTGFFGKVANALFYAGDLHGTPQSLCPHCHAYTDTLASVCRHCTRTLPPLVG
jgi:predicted RNA-binding Zn-ribbon protein involved in translation (DUF1610 family)